MALPDFEAWAIFATAARTGSFTATAEELGLSKPTVSKAVARLEARLDTVLFHRTSRSISLSSAGKALLPHAQRILAEGESAMEAARDTVHLLRGQIRLAAPLSFGLSHLAEPIADFMARYPEIAIDIQLSDEQVDLVQQGFDVAVRIAALADSSLRAIRLRRVERKFLAAPAYVERAGRPRHPNELSAHDCFIYSNLDGADIWRLTDKDGERVSVRPRCRLRTNNGSLEMAPLLAGLGISNLPDFIYGDALESGALVELLPEWQLEPIDLNLVMPPATHRPARVDVLIDFLRERLT